MNKGFFSGLVNKSLQKSFDDNECRLKNGDFVKHFKRETLNVEPDSPEHVYQIIELNAKSADNPNCIYTIYRALYGDKTVWVRKRDEFLSEVDHEKYPDIKQLYRLEKLSNEEEDLIIGGLFECQKQK